MSWCWQYVDISTFSLKHTPHGVRFLAKHFSSKNINTSFIGIKNATKTQRAHFFNSSKRYNSILSSHNKISIDDFTIVTSNTFLIANPTMSILLNRINDIRASTSVRGEERVGLEQLLQDGLISLDLFNSLSTESSSTYETRQNNLRFFPKNSLNTSDALLKFFLIRSNSICP